MQHAMNVLKSLVKMTLQLGVMADARSGITKSALGSPQ
jgi:hypothetical protein